MWQFAKCHTKIVHSLSYKRSSPSSSAKAPSERLGSSRSGTSRLRDFHSIEFRPADIPVWLNASRERLPRQQAYLLPGFSTPSLRPPPFRVDLAASGSSSLRPFPPSRPAAGVAIACACLFLVPPPGEISNSAISIVIELLVLAGAILGVKTSYDAKFVRIDAELRKKADKLENNE